MWSQDGARRAEGQAGGRARGPGAAPRVLSCGVTGMRFVPLRRDVTHCEEWSPGASRDPAPGVSMGAGHVGTSTPLIRGPRPRGTVGLSATRLSAERLGPGAVGSWWEPLELHAAAVGSQPSPLASGCSPHAAKPGHTSESGCASHQERCFERAINSRTFHHPEKNPVPISSHPHRPLPHFEPTSCLWTWPFWTCHGPGPLLPSSH